MSTLGQGKMLSFTIASGSTFSGHLELGGGFKRCELCIPTMTSASDIRILVHDEDRDFYRYLYTKPDSTNPGGTLINIGSAITNACVPFNLVTRHIRIELVDTPTATSNTFEINWSEN